MDFTEGVHENVTYEDYAAIPAWRSHDLTTLIRCPFSWQNQKPMEETAALLEGRVQHTVFLELDKFDDEFVIEPNVDRRTKIGKQEYADFLETVGHRRPIKQDLYDVCMERREVVGEYIPQPEDKVELTLMFYWFGEKCKCRLDHYNGRDIWDLKTCRDASPRGFRSAINNFFYYQQAAFYLMGCERVGLPVDNFWFLAQEKAYPYPYAVYGLTEKAIEYGNARNEQALDMGVKAQAGKIYKPFNVEEKVIFDATDLY